MIYATKADNQNKVAKKRGITEGMVSLPTDQRACFLSQTFIALSNSKPSLNGQRANLVIS